MQVRNIFDPPDKEKPHYDTPSLELISVYEEYGKSYALLGNSQKALDYVDKAYALGTPDIHWDMILKTSKVMALVRGGEIEAGTALALEAINECRRYGTIRLLERILVYTLIYSRCQRR